MNDPRQPAAAADEDRKVSTREFLRLFVALLLPMFLAAIDQTLLATATPATVHGWSTASTSASSPSPRWHWPAPCMPAASPTSASEIRVEIRVRDDLRRTRYLTLGISPRFPRPRSLRPAVRGVVGFFIA